MKKILSSPLFYPLLLVLICLFIVYINYTPGTFLTGWDTLHPEFNFSLNFARLFWGVWRSEQGFGAVSGHSAMADLPRVIILWLFHFIFNLSFLRYAYIFLCLILGPLGFYFLIKHLFHGLHIIDYGLRNLAFVGALVYLFNFGTVQQFYVPFEMFPTQWAFLPWIILSSLKYLHKPSKFGLLVFGFWTLMSTPQAYAAHLWYPFFGAFCLFVLIYKFNKHSFYLILITLLINSFWLLPNLYYIKTSSWIPQQNQQNRLHSQEFLLKNRQTGNLVDSTLIKGFYFDWQIYNFSDKKFQQLMPQWRDHSQNLDVKIIGYSLFLLSLFGLIFAICQKNRLLLSLSPFFIIPFILLSNTTFPFNFIFDFLLKIPLLAEILRFIFTKLSTLQTFGQAIFIVYFLNLLQTKYSPKIIFGIVVLCLAIYTAPIFSGYLISPLIRTQIPQEYFQFWQYMGQQPQGHILALPLHDPAGWTYDSWGYQGSGLIWFGLPQSITDRDNDRWQPVNEEAYREFTVALYSNNSVNLRHYLAKYKISYVFWDKNVMTTEPKNQDEITFKYETNTIINQLINQNILSPPHQFGNLFIYPVNNPPTSIEVNSNLPNVVPAYHWQYTDDAYQNSDYLTDLSLPAQTFPLRDVLNSTNRLDLNKFDPTKNNLPTTSITASDILSQNLSSPNVTFDSSNRTVSIYTNNQTHGVNLFEDSLPHQSGYIVGIKSLYLSGIPLRFCFKNTTTGLCLVEDELSQTINFGWDYFLIPPQDNGFGYNISLNAISLDNLLSLSQVQQITISPLPAVFLPTTASTTLYPTKFNTFLNQSFYQVDFNTFPNNSTLVLNQSFNQDWLAFYFQDHQIKFLSNHILINNWANGWSLPKTDYVLPITVYVFFWPQLLEFLGFGLLIGTFIWIIRMKHK